MRLRTIVAALAVAAPLIAFESAPAAAFGWCDWGLGYGSYGYAAPRRYGYYYRYAPRYYGGYYYGPRWGWRGYGYRGWRGYGYRGWRGYGYRGWHGARVSGHRAGLRGVRR